MDFDVHHGNGTEEIARAWHAKHRKAGYNGGADDSDLFFASIHLADDGAKTSIEFYPGTGVAAPASTRGPTMPACWLFSSANLTLSRI